MEWLLDFQYWYRELCAENRWGRSRGRIVLLIFVFGGAWIVHGWVVVGWGRKSYLGAAEIASFSCRDFNRSNKHKHDTFWQVVTTGYFYVLFLWAITVSYFYLLEIYKNVGFLLSTTTITVNSHADNHFYKYIYFQILHSLELVFLSKYRLRFDQGFLHSNLI